MTVRRALLFACMQACALLRAQAFAQAVEEPAPQASVPDSVPGAAPVAELPAPESPDAQLARSVVARAQALFTAGAYGAALAEFTRAHQLLDGDPRQAALLNNIAVCHERMFHYDLALAYYERYLREGTPEPRDRAEVEAAMRALRDLLGTLRVTGNVRGDVWVDDRKLGEIPAELLVPAGMHVVEVRAKAHESERREVRVTARSHATLHFDLSPLHAPRGVSQAYFWTGAGLTAAALITGSVLGVSALAKDDAGSARARDGFWVDGGRAKHLGLGADVAFGAALLFGAASTLLYFMTDWGDERRAHPPRGETQSFAWAPGVTNTSLSLEIAGQL